MLKIQLKSLKYSKNRDIRIRIDFSLVQSSNDSRCQENRLNYVTYVQGKTILNLKLLFELSIF